MAVQASPSQWFMGSCLINLKTEIPWPQRVSFRKEEFYYREFERKKHFESVAREVGCSG